MAFAQPRTLSSFSDMIMPGVDVVASRGAAEGIPIVSAHVQTDFVHDDIKLCVVHRLLSRRDLDMGQAHYIDALASRLQSAMRLFHRMPAAKALCVDRRRLVARGEKARKEANRPVRKAKRH